MRIPGVLRSIYWRRRLRSRHVRPWSDLPIDAHKARPSVAIVGNAGYLRDLEMGEQIDAYDVVVRMNNFAINGYERAVGCKVDMFVANFAEEIRFDNPAIADAKWIVSSVPCNFDKDRARGLRFRHGIHIARGLDLLNRDEVFVPSVAQVCERFDQLKALPTTGAMAIWLLTEGLCDRVGKVLIAGFSFYHGRSHYYSDQDIVPQMHAPDHEKTIIADHLHGLVAEGRVVLDPVMMRHVMASDNV